MHDPITIKKISADRVKRYCYASKPRLIDLRDVQNDTRTHR